MAGTGDTEMKPWTSGSQGQVGQPQTGKQPKSQMSNKDIRSSFRVWENRRLSALYHGDARKPLPLLCITKPPHHRNSSRWGRNVAGAELPWSTWRSGGEVFLPFLPPPKVGSAPSPRPGWRQPPQRQPRRRAERGDWGCGKRPAREQGSARGPMGLPPSSS